MNNGISITDKNSNKECFHNQMSANYEQDKSQLRSVFFKNILPCNEINVIYIVNDVLFKLVVI